MAPPGSGVIDTTTLSIGGSIGGLLLAVIAASSLFLVIRKKRGSEEMSVEDYEEETTGGFDEEITEVFDTGTSHEFIDHCVTEQNPEHEPTGKSSVLSSLSPTETPLRSPMAE
jgi:hypothetical protein